MNMRVFNVAIQKRGETVGFLAGENHTKKQERATRFYSVASASRAMGSARNAHPAWNVSDEYDMEVVPASPVNRSMK